MMHREVIAVCSEILKQHINVLCEQNMDFLNIKPSSTQNVTAALKGLIGCASQRQWHIFTYYPMSCLLGLSNDLKMISVGHTDIFCVLLNFVPSYYIPYLHLTVQNSAYKHADDVCTEWRLIHT
jgi:hypothetical protein